MGRSLGQNLGDPPAGIRDRVPAGGTAADEDHAGGADLGRLIKRLAVPGRARPTVREMGAIDKATLAARLSEVLEEDDILVSEYWADRPRCRRTRPGTYFATPPAAGLGWGLPAALGAKQAAPDRLVVAALGDGAYLFANPIVCHQIGAAEGLPVLTVVCNNARWGAVETATRGMYPAGAAVAGKAAMPLTRLHGLGHLERCVAVSGGHGVRVDRAEDLAAALREAAHIVRHQRRQAVVNVIAE